MCNWQVFLHYVLLAVIAWPGPRPTVHSHADCSHQPGETFLARHIALYHQASDRPSDDPGAPHCHWVCGNGFDALLPAKVVHESAEFSGRSVDEPRDWLEQLHAASAWLQAGELVGVPSSSSSVNSDSRPSEPGGPALHERLCVWTC